MFRTRRRLLLGAVLFLLPANTAGQLLNDTERVRVPTPHARNDHFCPLTAATPITTPRRTDD